MIAIPLAGAAGGLVVMALLTALAFLLIAPLALIAGKVPVVGAYIVSGLNNAGNVIMEWVHGIGNAVLPPIETVMAGLVSYPLALLNNVVVAIEDLTGWATSTASAVWSNVAGLSGRLSTLERALSAHLAAIVYAALAVPGVVSLAQYVYRVQVPAAQRAAEAAAARDAAAAQAAAISSAAAAVAAAERRAVLGLDAERGARAAADAAIRSASAAAIAAEAGRAIGIERGLDARLGQLGRAVDGELAQLTGELAPILTLALPLAIPALTEEVGTMRRECVDPLCGAFGPELGIVQGLTDAALLGGLAAFFVACVDDPKGTAAGVADLGGMIRGLTSPILEAFTGQAL